MPASLSAQINIFTINDGDTAALKSAINTSNSDGRDDIIILATNGTYTLTAADNGTNGLPVIGSDNNHSVRIEGHGATIQCSSGATFRVLDIASGANVAIDNLTITGGAVYGGLAAPAEYGGGIRNSGTLTLSGCHLTSNQANYGGGIGNSGTLVISECVFSNNTVSHCSDTFCPGSGGGAVSSGGSLTLSDSFFDTNSAGGSGTGGGAIRTGNGNGAVVRNCTFYNNSSTGAGGAIHNSATLLTVANCTFNGNTANLGGGGIYNEGAPTVVNDIFKASTILNGAGTFTSHGHNISDDNGGGVLTGSGDLTFTNAQLVTSTPQDNGGPTKTFALFPFSPAVNAGNDANAPARDQRGYARNGVSDIGAFEYGGTLTPLSVVSQKTHGPAGTFDISLPLTGAVGIECRKGQGTTSDDHQVIVTYPYPVTVDGLSVVSSDNMATVDPPPSGYNQVYTVNLHKVANAQTLTLTLINVRDGTNTFQNSVPMGVLLGDTNGNGSVSASDIAQTKANSGQALSASNFRTDVNVNGSINGSDIGLVKSKAGTVLP